MPAMRSCSERRKRMVGRWREMEESSKRVIKHASTLPDQSGSVRIQESGVNIKALDWGCVCVSTLWTTLNCLLQQNSWNPRQNETEITAKCSFFPLFFCLFPKSCHMVESFRWLLNGYFSLPDYFVFVTLCPRTVVLKRGSETQSGVMLAHFLNWLKWV